MTDLIERAVALEEAQRENALKAQARRAGLEGKSADNSAHECRVCTREIPQARREAYPGTQTCVDCQADLETAIAGGAAK